MVGDVVKFWDDSDIMTVEEVIFGEECRNGWGVPEDGIMMTGAHYGRVFDTLGAHSEVELIERPKQL